jgi:hypothetical protein
MSGGSPFMRETNQLANHDVSQSQKSENQNSRKMKKDRNHKFQNRTIRPIKRTDCDDEDVDAA